VQDYLYATSQMTQTTLRSVLGQQELDDLLASREKINQELTRIIDQHTNPLGGQGDSTPRISLERCGGCRVQPPRPPSQTHASPFRHR
jgi:regulator of protease activity HflC (stomatin/prohibitin superfamily)